jgi:dihydrolipoamide dehydrogenase
MNTPINTQVLVIGSGPGGYTAAFRAADLGKKVVLLEYYEQLGGVCLNVGCIPSKALLHVAQILEEAKELTNRGIHFTPPTIDLSALRNWVTTKTINKLTTGLKSLAKQRKVEVVTGHGEFINSNSVQVTDHGKNIIAQINFEQAIIAVGSRPIQLPNLPNDPKIMDSTKALALEDIPDKLLIIGGGIIGMELGTVYSALGSKVSVVELTKQLLPGADLDLVEIWQKHIKLKFDKIFLNTKVETVAVNNKYLEVKFTGEHSEHLKYDKILCAVGRRPNSDLIQADKIGLAIDNRGFIIVDKQLHTNIPHIFAIGDVAGQPMLAHKAIPEGKIAAEVICGKQHYFDTKIIPSVAYTDPEIAWVGLTEEQCKLQNTQYDKAIFPWAASGRALAIGRSEGSTKILFNPTTKQILGGGIVGMGASELIAEIAVAMEMGANAEDLGSIIHPHPTLSETICQAAELFSGTITDLPNKKL